MQFRQIKSYHSFINILDYQHSIFFLLYYMQYFGLEHTPMQIIPETRRVY